MIASLERYSTVPSWLRAACADFSVASSVRPVRKTCSSRSITACRRSVLASVTTSRAPSAMAAAMRVSSAAGANTSTGTVGASRSRTRITDPSSSWLSATCTSSSGLSCVSASPRSRSAGIQVQWAGCPASRSMLLTASTGSRAKLSTMSGTAFCSVKAASTGALAMAVDSSTATPAFRVRELAEISAERCGRAGGGWAMPLSYAALLSGRAGRSLQSARRAMASYTTNEIRGGLKVLPDGDPYTVIENEFVKPGKGQAFNRIKVRNLKTGRTIERTFKSGESLEAADVVDTGMQYLYHDGDFWHFMVPESFEQYTAGKSAVGENAQWLKDGVVCIVTLWNNVPLVVTPPPHIELKIVATDPGLRGDTATGGQKSAKVETGAVVRVPLFINEGEVIRIDTRTGEYISRARG